MSKTLVYWRGDYARAQYLNYIHQQHGKILSYDVTVINTSPMELREDDLPGYMRIHTSHWGARIPKDMIDNWFTVQHIEEEKEE